MSRFTREQLATILAQPGYVIGHAASYPAPVVAGLRHAKPERAAWEESLDTHEAQAEGKGRTCVVITRYGPGRLDKDNLYGGVKPILDALRYAGHVADDDPDTITLVVRQRKIPKAEAGTEILIIRGA